MSTDTIFTKMRDLSLRVKGLSDIFQKDLIARAVEKPKIRGPSMLSMTIAEKKRFPRKEGPRTFEEAAREVMREVQEGFARLIAAVPGPSRISKAAEFQKALGVDPKLGWRVFRIANAENPLSVGSEVPSAVSMRKLFKAALKQRVPESVVKRAASAFDEFEMLVREHAGDRDSFASMVSALDGDEESPIDLQSRRAAFAANSHILGVQARTRLCCAIGVPSKEHQDRADLAYVRGFVDLRWLRAEHSPVLMSSAAHQDRSADPVHPRLEPIEPASDPSVGETLLERFCSQPLPTLRTIMSSNGQRVNTVLVSEDVGNNSTRTCIGAYVFRGVNPYSSDGSRQNTINALVRVPVQVLVFDVLQHERYVVSDPSVKIYSDLQSPTGANFSDTGVLLPQSPTVKCLGSGADLLQTRDVPRYPEMVEYVAGKLGIDLKQLRVYRCRVEYPFMPSSVVMSFEAPAPPKPSH